MNILKNLFYVVILSFGAVSSNTYAADDAAAIKVSLEQTVAKIEETLAAIAKNEDNNKIAEMIVEARQLQKGISTSDSKVSVKRSQSNHKLVRARNSIMDGDLKAGEASLKEALAGYKEVEEKFKAAH